MLRVHRDPRNPAAPLRAHNYTHSDDITAVRFLKSHHQPHAEAHNILLSASMDGLVCTSNADEPDEDEAGLHVGNWGCSIAQVGWVNGRSGSPAIWASSDMETFSAWSSEVNLQLPCATKSGANSVWCGALKLDLVQNSDIRQPSVHRSDFTWVTDYLIGCHNSVAIPPERDNDLHLFLGSNE